MHLPLRTGATIRTLSKPWLTPVWIPSIANCASRPNLVRSERTREPPVRAAERSLGRSLRIEMDELMILGEVGKALNHLRGHGYPVAEPDLLPDPGSQRIGALQLHAQYPSNRRVRFRAQSTPF